MGHHPALEGSDGHPLLLARKAMRDTGTKTMGKAGPHCDCFLNSPVPPHTRTDTNLASGFTKDVTSLSLLCFVIQFLFQGTHIHAFGT